MNIVVKFKSGGIGSGDPTGIKFPKDHLVAIVPHDPEKYFFAMQIIPRPADWESPRPMTGAWVGGFFNNTRHPPPPQRHPDGSYVGNSTDVSHGLSWQSQD